MFSICFVHDEPAVSVKTDLRHEAMGCITIGAFSEHFVSDITFWSMEEYSRQWREGLVRICDGHASSCLFTNVGNPEHANYFEGWILYRLGADEIAIHNRLIFFSLLEQPFLFDAKYDVVPAYAAVGVDGERISEWRTSIGAIQRFLALQNL
jgi:hypothetical protein